MYNYIVEIHWTNWLDEYSDDWNSQDVLYMYANNNESIYIGEAGNETVKKRHNSHFKDGVIEWIKKRYSWFNIKVGHPEFPEGSYFSLEKLYDIQTLLIYKEYNNRGYCLANIHSTKTRDISRPGMIVVNFGHFHPLLDCYRDDPL